jgi:hypothetical protein
VLNTQLPTSPRSCEYDQNDCAGKALDNRNERRRQWLIILFAAVLVSIAGFASAENPLSSIQYDTTTSAGHSPHPGAVIDRHRVDGGAIPVSPNALSRPVFVEMSARLANFDADSDPDGWRAEIVLRDRKDRPTRFRSHAAFELMPRISMVTANRYIDAEISPIRWSMPLEFDQDGIARVKLPLRQSLRPMLGWSTAVFPQSGMRSHNSGYDRRQISIYSRTRSFVTLDLHDAIGMPNVGVLRVRVSVPTQGVFESAVGVKIRPSVLVDTEWPYR